MIPSLSFCNPTTCYSRSLKPTPYRPLKICKILSANTMKISRCAHLFAFLGRYSQASSHTFLWTSPSRFFRRITCYYKTARGESCLVLFCASLSTGYLACFLSKPMAPYKLLLICFGNSCCIRYMVAFKTAVACGRKTRPGTKTSRDDKRISAARFSASIDHGKNRSTTATL